MTNSKSNVISIELHPHYLKRKQQRGQRSGVREFILEYADLKVNVSKKREQAWHYMLSRRKAHLLSKNNQLPSHLKIEDVTDKYLIILIDETGNMIIKTFAHYTERLKKNRKPGQARRKSRRGENG